MIYKIESRSEETHLSRVVHLKSPMCHMVERTLRVYKCNVAILSVIIWGNFKNSVTQLM